jgi:hypothetical protein
MNCTPQVLKDPQQIPDYICKNNKKKFLSIEEKKDYEYGGPLPTLCDITDRKFCPDVSYLGKEEGMKVCSADPKCQWISYSVIDKNSPNMCYPRQQPGCVSLTEADLKKEDKDLTDSVCNRLDVGGIFNRGTGDGKSSRKGPPTCLRGCLGSKYYKNPKYMWGGGSNFTGAWDFPDLKLGPKYLEASPSQKNPDGWGGPKVSPWDGNGLLPVSLGEPYTRSKGKYSPPCNLPEGDFGSFTGTGSGEDLAGPGCILTPPRPQSNINDWGYSCNCTYNSGEIKKDAWRPCTEWELNEEIQSDRNLCKGCRIQDNPSQKMYGHCVLGEENIDTESRLIDCEEDPKYPEKCRTNRVVDPIDCPAFCSKDPSDPKGWMPETQCSQFIEKGCWTPNPEYKKIISEFDRKTRNRVSPYIQGKQKCSSVKTDDLCRNCSQSELQYHGAGSEYPFYSHCVVGGKTESDSMQHGTYGAELSRNTTCPPTCKQCMTGQNGEPVEAIYKLDESMNDSIFKTDIIYVPWIRK